MVIAVALSHTPFPFVSLSRSTLALQPFLLQQWASELGWNYPSWSISTEAEAYVYFVFFAELLMTVRNPRLIAVCCVVVLIGLSVSNGGSLNCFVRVRALLRTLSGFTLGVLLFRINASKTGPPPGGWGCGRFSSLPVR